MTVAKMKVAALSLVATLGISTVLGSVALAAQDASNNTSSSVTCGPESITSSINTKICPDSKLADGSDQCEYCTMIDTLYANEDDTLLHDLNVIAMKSIIHPGRGENRPNTRGAELIALIDFRPDLKYKLSSMGLKQGWPLEGLSSDGKWCIWSKSSDAEADQYKQDLSSVYNFVMNNVEVAKQLETESERVQYYADVISQNLEYDYSFSTWKLNNIIKSGKSICVGYCELFYLMCINSGIDCELTGNKQHMFNVIHEADGTNRYVDVTWYDMCSDKRKPLYVDATPEILNDGYHYTLACLGGTGADPVPNEHSSVTVPIPQ